MLTTNIPASRLSDAIIKNRLFKNELPHLKYGFYIVVVGNGTTAIALVPGWVRRPQ
jgi:hypothetical protein